MLGKVEVIHLIPPRWSDPHTISSFQTSIHVRFQRKCDCWKVKTEHTTGKSQYSTFSSSQFAFSPPSSLHLFPAYISFQLAKMRLIYKTKYLDEKLSASVSLYVEDGYWGKSQMFSLTSLCISCPWSCSLRNAHTLNLIFLRMIAPTLGRRIINLFTPKWHGFPQNIPPNWLDRPAFLHRWHGTLHILVLSLPFGSWITP